MLALVCDAIDIEHHTTVIGAQAKFFGLGKRHILDNQLVFKQSVEECYQTFFRVLASKDSLESPIDTWVYKSCHLLTFYKVVDAILLFGGKDTTFPRNFQGFREKILEKDGEKEKNRRLPEFESRLLIILFLYYDETNAYFTVQ